MVGPLLGGIFLTYLVTRLLLLWRLPVFWDDGFYAVQAQTGLDLPAERFQFLGDGKPPLFNWVSIGVRVRASGGCTLEFAAATADNLGRARFVLQHDTFGLPQGINLDDFHQVFSYRRPSGDSTQQGQQQPVTTVQLYERN